MSACEYDQFIKCYLPVAKIKQLLVAWREFEARPWDWDAFERLEWAMHTAYASFCTYATDRRVEASREKPLP